MSPDGSESTEAGGGAAAHSTYQSPLAGRYASREMQAIWSPKRKFELWRRIWLSVAQAQHELGLPITREQLDELASRMEVTEEDLGRAAEHERRLRHDVMAHVHAWGDVCPNARGIIHLGLTSQDVVCNADLCTLYHALDLVVTKLVRVTDELVTFGQRWKHLPTLGFTHYQPAQPTTVGRRAVGWAADLRLCLERHRNTMLHRLRLRGFKGATGTQASFLELFDGDHDKVLEFERRAYEKFMPDPSMDRDYKVTGQTYPRVVDAFILSDLAATASVAHKIATDIRLLCNLREIDEPFERTQIGSSSMPYKRNPMRSERVCALSRFVINLAANAYQTESVQWLERTLDDSANRRLVLPEAFLALDGVLEVMHNVCAGLVVNEGVISRRLRDELPFLASENLMMGAVKAGGDRQRVHEAIRRHAMEASARMKSEGADSDLLERLRAEPLLGGVDLDAALDPKAYVGRAPEQVREFAESWRVIREDFVDRLTEPPMLHV